MVMFLFIWVLDIFNLHWVNLCVLSLLYRYHLQDVVIGKIYFLLVRLKIKHMELQLLRKEVRGSGTKNLNFKCILVLFLFHFTCVIILCFQYVLLTPQKWGNMFLPALVCHCVCVCLSVTKITKKNVDGFVPNFMGRFIGGKGRPSSCFVTIGRGMWK